MASLHLSLLMVFFTVLVNDVTPAVIQSNKSGAGVQTCDDVITLYTYLGYPVEDCAEDEKGKSLFWRVDTPMSFDNARNICRSVLNADLAIAKNFLQRQIFISLVSMKVTKNIETWIGIERQANGTLFYIDGTAVEASRWPTAWGGDLPTAPNNCGLLLWNWENTDYFGSAGYQDYYIGLWYYPAMCDLTNVFICQAHY